MTTEYSKRLGSISAAQFQKALDHFDLGQFIRAEPIPFGLFGQNVFVTSSAGEFVLRGAAHYDWQFPKEQFIATLLHERSDVAVPYPYLFDRDESIFGWNDGYVLMPRMPGLQLADTAVRKTLSHQDRNAVAYALGENLREIQRVPWQFAGQYDLKTQTIVPFQDGFGNWLVNELRQLVYQSQSYQTGTDETDVMWVEQIIQQAEEALQMPYTPVMVMHDYKESNLTVENHGNCWQVSGVFDFMEALFGDGELDLVRQLAIYTDEKEPTWAKSFLDGYLECEPLRPMAKKRITLYMVYDRMVVWEYFHRPANLSLWWGGEISFEAWLSLYLHQIERLL